jgi:hypothetical protein
MRAGKLAMFTPVNPFVWFSGENREQTEKAKKVVCDFERILERRQKSKNPSRTRKTPCQ